MSLYTLNHFLFIYIIKNHWIISGVATAFAYVLCWRGSIVGNTGVNRGISFGVGDANIVKSCVCGIVYFNIGGKRIVDRRQDDRTGFTLLKKKC
jgi:hypothetical protein